MQRKLELKYKVWILKSCWWVAGCTDIVRDVKNTRPKSLLILCFVLCLLAILNNMKHDVQELNKF